jgi:D-beta-D-heptose 7-phosphate kinase/D-beta-D-heptose 1-phosphate adenosyltransferase
VTLITPNIREAEAMSGIAIEDTRSLEQAGRRLLRELACEIVLITEGEKGMTLLERRGDPVPIHTVARKVFDVTGAGDTVISTFTLGLTAGLTPYQAAVVANVAAGIVVGEVGTATVPAERLKEVLLDGVKRKGRRRAS